MSKYIDAEKLLSEIERRKKQDTTIRERSILIDIETAIASLQQEQPFPRWIHANYSDKPEIRHSPSGDSYLQNGSYMIWLSDLETLPKDGTDLTNPGPQQPEMDWEKVFAHEYAIYNLPTFIIASIVNGTELIDFIYKTARHFYELGFNARKDDNR